jgi:hypothetical protein
MQRLGAPLALLALAGCGRSVASQLRTSTPGEAAAAALAEYDGDKNGKLEAAELESCPALVDAQSRIDSNRDGAIDAAELEARFTAHDGMSDLVGFEVRVTSNKAPLAGATVTYTPEPFMGEGKQTYEGISTDGGSCYVEGQDVKLPGVPVGFYKVRIVHGPSGVDVTRGCEVADDSPSSNRMAFDAKLTTPGPAAAGRR